jgi:hypothetical protein
MSNAEKAEARPSIHYDPEQNKLTVRGVTEFPQEVFEYSDDLEILDISNNNLATLPDNLSALKNMRIAFCSGNNFKEVPKVLASCENLAMVGLKSCGIETMGDNTLPHSLRGLILTDNNLTRLPDSIGEYKSLQKLMLTGNQLPSVPQALLELKQLELLRIAGNRLLESPNWLSALPNLAWYADSENDFNPTPLLESFQAKEFNWSDIRLGTKLGESAKNVVYSATLNSHEQIAVKIFGEGITTDGSPGNDITASLLAGGHPNVIGGLGKLVHSQNGEQGLVMPIISQEYKTLGLPPNFTDLTRDSYPQETKFTIPIVLRIARDIGSALQHLHSKGVMHGDVYAHNILTAPSGESKLGDFGAASIYDIHSPSEKWREKLDVAGYGHLIEELIQNIADSSATSGLRELSRACLNKSVFDRPSFKDINESLRHLKFAKS